MANSMFAEPQPAATTPGAFDNIYIKNRATRMEMFQSGAVRP